jgi:imidazolonepropionase-like amidohydrolase
MQRKRLLILAFAVLAAGPWSYGNTQTGALVVTDTTLIDGVSEAARPNMSVVIRGDRIAAVGAADNIEMPAGATVIDGSGKFLIPGLWDTHAHLSYWGEDALDLLVRAGVTSIRELGGDPEEIGAWKAEIESGDRIGPAMIWCGPFLEGVDGDDEYRFKVADENEARYAARALQALGVDFLKIQPIIASELVEALVDESRNLGLTVVGHLPRGISASEGAALGLRSIEHMSPYLRLTDDELAAVIAAYLAHGTWMSPALYSIVAPIEAAGGDPANDARVQRAYEIVRRFHRAGVPVLVGSNFAYRDWPQKPGSGLHGEMRVLVEAGLTEMEVIRLATATAAAFAGAAEESGAIRPGLSADMVLLDADPLADIRNTERISRVILRGQVLSTR